MSQNPDPPHGSWFLRIAGGGLALTDVLEFLAARETAAVHVASDGDRLVIRTVPAPIAVVNDVVQALRHLGARVLALPVIEAPRV